MTSLTNLMKVTETHDIIYWPLIDLKDTLYDQLLNHMTYNDQRMTSMTNNDHSENDHIMTIKWQQSLWPVTESHDII